MKKTVAIAGATGFIGKWFIDKYKNEFNIIALSRNKLRYPEKSNIHWKQVDLYSISSTTKALENVDIGISCGFLLISLKKRPLLSLFGHPFY